MVRSPKAEELAGDRRPMLVVVGLRNPGREYQGSRHNVGAEVLGMLAQRWGVRFRRGPLRARTELAQARVRGRSVVLSLPKSAMNVSGEAVAALLRYLGIGTESLLVCHDDIDLAFGRLRLQFGRGAGGHNGVESVVKALKTTDFDRLKVGVGRPPGKMDPADFVLRPFTAQEREEVDLMIRDAADIVDRFVDDAVTAVRMAGERRV